MSRGPDGGVVDGPTTPRSGDGPGFDATEPERARRTLAAGLLVFRWGALGWMGILAATAGGYRRPWLVVAALGGTVAWNVRLTLGRGRLSEPDRWTDLALAVGLITVSALVVPTGEVAGPRPFLAAMYPGAAALAWGAERGPWRGLFAGAVLSAALTLSRPLNGLPLSEMTLAQAQGVANGIVYFLLAGGVAGVISRLLDRSARELRLATETAMRERERVARYAEREVLAREIHDSVLQALALVNKRGRELAARATVPGSDVGALAAVASDQERALRDLLLRPPADPPAGRASLREALEAVAREIPGARATVSAVGPLHVPAHHAAEVAAAVRQALSNVERHAAASRAIVFADASEGVVTVSVRDDGRGFEMDAERLRRDGRGGILKSVIGRVEDLGGEVRVTSAPGSGTEVEIRVPISPEGAA